MNIQTTNEQEPNEANPNPSNEALHGTTPSKPEDNWFEDFRQTSFPSASLPASLANHVRYVAARFHIAEEFVAATALAQLAGMAGEDSRVVTTSGSPVAVPFNLIVAAPSTPSFGYALDESNAVLEQHQRERLGEAAKLDKKRIEQLRTGPLHRLPDYITTGDDSAKNIQSRMQAIHVARNPVFWVEAGGSHEIRAGFAASHDRTLLISYARMNVVKSLVDPRDREGIQLRELLCRLASGGQIELPKSHSESCPLIQPRMGFLAVSDSATLEQAILSECPGVQALIRNSILLTVVNAAPPAVPSQTPSARGASTYWNTIVRRLLDARRDHYHGIAPHPAFYDAFEAWQTRLQQYARKLPENLNGHLASFAKLPLKLGALFLVLENYGGFRDVDAAKAAITIAEWLLARTLITAYDAYHAARRKADADAQERMLEKIREGPTDFVNLRRRFADQRKDRHAPVLAALIEQKRVHFNSEGKLEAA